MSGDELVIIMGWRPSAPYQGASPWAGLLNSLVLLPPLSAYLFLYSSLKGQCSAQSQLSAPLVVYRVRPHLPSIPVTSLKQHQHIFFSNNDFNIILTFDLKLGDSCRLRSHLFELKNTTEEVVIKPHSHQPGQLGALAAFSQWCHIIPVCRSFNSTPKRQLIYFFLARNTTLITSPQSLKCYNAVETLKCRNLEQNVPKIFHRGEENGQIFNCGEGGEGGRGGCFCLIRQNLFTL